MTLSHDKSKPHCISSCNRTIEPCCVLCCCVGRRLEQEVVSSRLWIEECQQLQPPLPDAVPTTFHSLEQYIAAFEPLLIEEAAESVRSGYEESERAGKSVPVAVQL